MRYMRITSKSFNEYSEKESRFLLSNLAKIYGDKDIKMGDVMAYFFLRYMPSSIVKFVEANKRIFSKEFGITRDRIRIISGNYLPTFGQMCDVIKTHSNNERLELFAYLCLFFPQRQIIGFRPGDVGYTIYDIQIPSWLAQRLEIFAQTRYGYEYLFHDIHFDETKMLSSFSTLNYILKQKTGLYALEYVSLRMRMLGTFGVMFCNDKMRARNSRAKSLITKKLAKKKK